MQFREALRRSEKEFRMQPRVDINLGIHGEPDDWLHSACILCSNGCALTSR